MNDGYGGANASGEGGQVVGVWRGHHAIEALKRLSGFWQGWGALLCVIDRNPDRGIQVANFALHSCGEQGTPEARLECGLRCPFL